MKKFFSAVIICASLISLCACGGTDIKKEKPGIVVTIFPEYDWVMNIIGEHADDYTVTMLADSGTDLHSFQPTADDIIKISSCDLFVYVGGESDEWVKSVLESAQNKNIKAINLLSVLGGKAKEEETPEGAAHEDEEEKEYDEHVWLSLGNAALFCREICGALSETDKENAEEYSENTEEYIKKLEALDGRYRSELSSAAQKTVLFGDRFPFRYLLDDYGIGSYAAFSGCSAESEASFETIAFLAGKVDEFSLPAVLTTEGSDGRTAETIVAATKSKSAKILSLDSLQSVTKKDAGRKTYLSAMEKNLEVLKEALGTGGN